jgi:hypothetical protein
MILCSQHEGNYDRLSKNNSKNGQISVPSKRSNVIFDIHKPIDTSIQGGIKKLIEIRGVDKRKERRV